MPGAPAPTPPMSAHTCAPHSHPLPGGSRRAATTRIVLGFEHRHDGAPIASFLTSRRYRKRVKWPSKVVHTMTLALSRWTSKSRLLSATAAKSRVWFDPPIHTALSTPTHTPSVDNDTFQHPPQSSPSASHNDVTRSVHCSIHHLHTRVGSAGNMLDRAFETDPRLPEQGSKTPPRTGRSGADLGPIGSYAGSANQRASK